MSRPYPLLWVVPLVLTGQGVRCRADGAQIPGELGMLPVTIASWLPHAESKSRFEDTPDAMDRTQEQTRLRTELRKGTCRTAVAQDATAIGPFDTSQSGALGW